MSELIGKGMFPSMVKDPFSKDCIIGIHAHMTKNVFIDGYTFRSSIEFKNQNTNGAQNFSASTFKDLFAQMEAFIESLQH